MFFISKTHGKIEYDKNNEVTFKKEILGFDGLKNFILVDLKECQPFKLLHSLENDEIGLIMVSPFEICKNYEVKLTDEIIDRLKIKNPEDVMLLTTVTISSKPKNTTTNLKAPFVINICNGLGEQIILDKVEYSIKHPLIKE